MKKAAKAELSNVVSCLVLANDIALKPCVSEKDVR